jgi:hypothetical protein
LIVFGNKSEFLIEEAHHFIGFREVFSISSINRMKLRQLKERRLEAKDLRYDAQAFENNSTIGERGLVAETIVRSKILNDRQKPVTDCNIDSAYLKTCLESEIDPMFLIRGFSEKVFITSSNISSNNSSIYYQNPSFKDEEHHHHSKTIRS